MNKLDDYIYNCFVDAHKSEGRPFDKGNFSFDYIIFNNSLLYPIAWCKYDRVLRKVMYRLNRNLEKNFNIKMIQTGFCIYEAVQTLDNNFTLCTFDIKRGNKTKSYFLITLLDDEYYGNLCMSKTGGSTDVPYLYMLDRYNKINGTNKDMLSWHVKDFKEYKKLWLECFGDFHPDIKITGTSENLTFVA